MAGQTYRLDRDGARGCADDLGRVANAVEARDSIPITELPDPLRHAVSQLRSTESQLSRAFGGGLRHLGRATDQLIDDVLAADR